MSPDPRPPAARHGPDPRGTRPAQNPHDPEGIGDILTRWIQKNQVKDRLRGGSVFGRWKEIVGPDLAASTRPVRSSGGTLTVEVASAPLLNELATFRKKEILRAVQAIEEFKGIRDIRFRAGSA